VLGDPLFTIYLWNPEKISSVLLAVYQVKV